MRIIYQAKVARDIQYESIRIVTQGDTPEAVREDRDRQVALFGATDVIAVGLDNARSDWEACFGPAADYVDTAFAQSPSNLKNPQRSLVRKWVDKLKGACVNRDTRQVNR